MHGFMSFVPSRHRIFRLFTQCKLWNYTFHKTERWMKMNRALSYPLIIVSKWLQEDIKDLTFPSVNITLISFWMSKYTFENARTSNISALFSHWLEMWGTWNFSFWMFPFFFLENWKTMLKKFILDNSNLLDHFHIQSYSFTNCVLKFKAILRPRFSKQRLAIIFVEQSTFPTFFRSISCMSYNILSYHLATSNKKPPSILLPKTLSKMNTNSLYPLDTSIASNPALVTFYKK